MTSKQKETRGRPSSGIDRKEQQRIAQAKFREQMKAEGKKQVTFWLPKELIEEMKRVSAETGETLSDVIEMHIVAGMDHL